MKEAIFEFREEVAESINNIHLDMLRQFQAHSDEMNSLFQKQWALIDDLVKENRALRDENDRFRMAY